MNEKYLTKKICGWLKEQGFYPETEVTLGKRGRKIRVDIYVDRKPLPSLAIEVKGDKAGLFDGIGKAMFYSAYTNCEVWLAMPSNMCKLASRLLPLRLPFKLFDTTKMQLIEDKTSTKTPTRPTLNIYVCPLCGEKIGNVNEKGWLKLHLQRRHDTSIEELFKAIRIYRALRYDETLKRQVEYALAHSEEFEYAEGGESEWKELEW